MRLVPDEQEQEICRALRLHCERQFPLGGAMLGAEDVDWTAVEEAGWFDIGGPRSDGGLGLLGSAFVARELGRSLAPSCLLPTVIAFAIAVDNRWVDLADRIRSGRAACGWWADGIDPAGARPLVSGGRVALGLRTDGENVELVDVIEHVRPARSMAESEPAWLVRAGARHRVADGGQSAAARALVWTLLAAASAGIGEVVTERSVTYAGLRHQFGQPIGSFQAVAHRCADMAVRARTSWHQTVYASLAFEDLPDERLVEAAAARVLSADAAVRNSAANVQNHGGIGFSAEAHEHRFVKRAQLLHRVAGGPAGAHDVLASAALDDDGRSSCSTCA